MAVKVEMPKLSDTMEEGVIAKWNVSEGDTVESGDVIAEVETDKATMEVEVFDAGTILKILVEEGAAVPLGEVMAVIGEEGEDISDITGGGSGSSDGDSDGESEESEDEAEEKVDAEAESEDEQGDVEAEDEEKTENKDKKNAKDDDTSSDDQDKKKSKKEGGNKLSKPQGSKSGKKESSQKKSSSSSKNGRIKASPLARKMAEDQGIELSRVDGSGPEGRIIKKDIEGYEPPAHQPAAQSAMQSSREDKEHAISQMRKTIARRLAESKYTNPHYYETIDIDVEQLFAARKQINEMIEGKISFNDIIVKACSAALRKHPMVNSSWQDDVILEHGDVNVAVAVAIDEGLLTPVIRNSDQKGLQQIGRETKELAEKARNRKLQPEQMEGSTFTVSNLGMFGIEEFTAIINPPNACILAVGAIRDVPVVKDGEVVPGKRMKVTLSSDHRIVDGATAAQFLSTLRGYIANPLGMLL
jgi:pyruvate dehydrogenase E2 component (dihydrolipoamide acetyltransferase)